MKRHITRQGVRYDPLDKVVRFTITTEIIGQNRLPREMIEAIAEASTDALAGIVRRVQGSVPEDHYVLATRSFEGRTHTDGSYSVVFEWQAYKRADIHEDLERHQNRGD